MNSAARSLGTVQLYINKIYITCDVQNITCFCSRHFCIRQRCPLFPDFINFSSLMKLLLLLRVEVMLFQYYSLSSSEVQSFLLFSTNSTRSKICKHLSIINSRVCGNLSKIFLHSHTNTYYLIRKWAWAARCCVAFAVVKQIFKGRARKPPCQAPARRRNTTSR